MKIISLIGDTLSFNPSFDSGIIDAAYADDPQAASAEYGAQFRSDLQGFVTREIVEACKVVDRYELPPLPSFRYVAFTDPSGGSSDSFTLAISHNENGISILDCLREIRAPFSPSAAVKELAEVLKTYHCYEVTGDKYAGLWPTDQFAKYAIKYIPSQRTKSEIYLECLPLLNSRKVQLLDQRKLTVQLCSLERKTRAGGKDTIDHPPGGKDDCINSAAGSLVLAQKRRSAFRGIYLDGTSDFSGTDAAYTKREAENDKQYIASIPEKETENAVQKYLRRLEKELLG